MQGLQYKVDLIFCIDKTGSMSPVIDMVKEHAIKFYDDMGEVFKKKHKDVDALRIKVIAFGDVDFDKEKWLAESDFYDMPSQKSEFESFVQTIHAEGGGPTPENGLEALTLAINSDWCKDGDKRRHVVVVYTDAPTHTLEHTQSLSSPHYPDGMPSSFDDLSDIWLDEQDSDRYNQRLVLFAPDAYPWSDMYTHWEGVIQMASQAGKGLEEYDYNVILDTIANSC